MSAEAWSIIATGIVVLVAIATSHRSLRAEFKAEFRAEVGNLRSEMASLRSEIEKLRERIDQVEKNLSERITRLEIEVRERLAHLEGTVGIVREAVIGGGPREAGSRNRKAAVK